MAKLRKGVSYRRLERPYTRKSKYQRKSFVRAIPANRIVRYHMGDPNVAYEETYELIITRGCQLRHNAIEAGRLTCNKLLEQKIGKTGFHAHLLIFPHHVLRENPLASGAGADRMSTGMQRSFGKVIGLAAQVKPNQPIMRISVNKQHASLAKESLQRAAHKLPVHCIIRKRA